jgi:hypothetical protein
MSACPRFPYEAADCAFNPLSFCDNDVDPNRTSICLGTSSYVIFSVGSATAASAICDLPIDPVISFSTLLGQGIGSVLGLSAPLCLCPTPTPCQKVIAKIFCAALAQGAGIGCFTGVSSLVAPVGTALKGAFLSQALQSVLLMQARALSRCCCRRPPPPSVVPDPIAIPRIEIEQS